MTRPDTPTPHLLARQGPLRSDTGLLGRGLSRRTLFRGFGAGVLAVAGTGTLASCGTDGATGGGADGGGEASLGEVTYISFLPFETLSFAAEMLAMAAGHDAAHGIDLGYEVARGTSPSLQAMIAGAGLVARCNTVDLAAARAQGQDVVNIATIARGPAQRINFSKERPITTAQDMVGMTIGIPSEGGSTENNLRLTLENAGVDSEQVNLQVVTDNPASWEMIQRGQIDGYISSPDQSFLLLDMQEGADAIVLGDLSPVISDRQYFVTTDQHIQEKPDQLRAFLASLEDAVTSMVDDTDRTKTLEALREENSFASLDNDSVARSALDVQVENFVNDEEPDPLVTDEEIWLASIEELVTTGRIEPVDAPESWMTNDLLPA
ncbi:ABC transporter substrate-binding protein [Citricoccus sp. K5]|uniref:ABC transporter substrate-binding protein n=1 Tax=Citricoccus sp. K5 TaxID=2653135 RepID=UPI0012F32C96|nr:ABC transporter substrate-binding protein [Citricoccus sp. K5]VXA90872.1 ABC-type nitrate/sulfonate/bicarbonate transport system, periplasmic component [Citricoccus sp. K5]